MGTRNIKQVKIFIVLFCALFGIVCVSFQRGQAEFDATSVVVPPSSDAYIASGKPDDHFETRPGLFTGYNVSFGLKIERSYLKFDLANIPIGSTVQSAILRLHEGQSAGSNTAMNVSVRRVNVEWPDNLSWNRQESLGLINQLSGPSVSIPVTAGLGRYEWNITELVQSWVNQRQPNAYLGLVLQGSEAPQEFERGFYSSNCPVEICPPGSNKLPSLEIQFASPTPTPSPTPPPSPTPTPGASVSLNNHPDEVIWRDQEITYTLVYRNNGVVPLVAVMITGSIPISAALVDESVVPTVTLRLNRPDIVVWAIGTLTQTQVGQVSYRVRCVDCPPAPSTAYFPPLVIENKGAVISWQFGAPPVFGNTVSNSVKNPAAKLYIPYVQK